MPNPLNTNSYKKIRNYKQALYDNSISRNSDDVVITAE